MAMAQDTNNDLIRKKEDLLVEQTKLQGTIKYLQAERQEMDKAGQTTWDNIERDYGMYLRSPE
jgi:TRAP-type C4-dicarboxylate transport system substrate-binding protein